jgi:hypothetical protein
MARHLIAEQVRRGPRDGPHVAADHLEPHDVDEGAGDVDGQEVRAEIDPRRVGSVEFNLVGRLRTLSSLQPPRERSLLVPRS